MVCKAASKVRKNVTLEKRKISKSVKLSNGTPVEVILEDRSSNIEGSLAESKSEWEFC